MWNNELRESPLTPTGEAILQLRQVYPHGHKRFLDLTVAELQLHSDKNHDYAAGGDPLGNFKRVAATLAQYPGLSLSDPAVVALVYAMKQVDAYLWMKSNKHEAKVEGLGARLQDVSVYAKLARILDEEPTSSAQNTPLPWTPPPQGTTS